MTIAGTSDLIECLITQSAEIASAGHNGWGNTMLDAAEALASAQRGKEAAERELEECQRKAAFDDALCKVQEGLIERLQQERDRLAARLDAAEKLLQEIRLDGCYPDESMNDLWDRTIERIDAYDSALSSSPSTSAVAEVDK